MCVNERNWPDGNEGYHRPPIANTQIYILDRQLNPMPVGVPGELHIGGAGLARGYHNRPELTAEKFISNPFCADPRERLYKTGDLARYLPDGNIEYLGRLDHQVKLRGFRVELGEIEEVLNQHPGVEASVVVAREDTPGNKRLAAYLVNRNGAIGASELREYLRIKLPDYMVPAAFVTLHQFPLTPNGKVDRKALPKPDSEAVLDKDKFVAPSTPTEMALTEIWCEVLGLKHIGIHDGFFELGGHSMLAVQLIGKIKRSLSFDLSIPALFQNQTVYKLAALIDGDKPQAPQPETPRRTEASGPLLTFRATGSRPPLFFLHGDWTGGGLYCGQLSERLGEDQPFYALPPCRPDKRSTLTVRQMAASYIAIIRKHTPHGPYLLGGYCFGAVVATEIASQLVAQGERVDYLLVVAHPHLVNSQWIPEMWPVFNSLGSALKWNLQRKIYNFDRYGIRFARWLQKSSREKLGNLGSRLKAPGRIAASSIKIGQVKGDQELLKSPDYAVFRLAYSLYKTKPFPVPTTLYFPEEAPVAQIPWDKRIRDSLPPVTVETVPGNHDNCITKYGATLGDKMRATLDCLPGALICQNES